MNDQPKTVVARSAFGLALAVGMSGLLAPGEGSAQQITLRVADHYPAGSASADMTAGHFMREVTRRTDGRVTFEYFPTEQLGRARDMLTLTLTGVTDIGFAAPAYVSDTLPLGGVVELPGTFLHPCDGTRAFYEMATDGILLEREYQPNGIRLLIALALPPYQVLTKDELRGLPDMAGKRLRTGGGAQDMSMEQVGAVPVRMAGPDIYESLHRGTLDGLVFPLPSLEQYSLEELLRYSTRGMNFGSFMSSYVISERRWNELPEDIREIMAEVGAETSMHACERMANDIEPAMERLAAAGIEFVDFSDEDRARIEELLAPVGEAWAEQMNRRGLPGTEVFETFVSKLPD
jgi:TRAP-type C4-dicarboxylate transport system substrate-binding protein